MSSTPKAKTSAKDAPDFQAVLARVLETGALPAEVRETAETLVARLAKPVRVAVMGPPGSGKSSVLNLLAGAEIVPPGLPLPTLELVHGPNDAIRARVTLADGTTEVLDDAHPEDIAALNPVFVEQKVDLPALGKISLLEVVAGETETELTRAAAWASKRSDMAIWCTRRYRAPERAAWTALPDVLKDHGVLLVTHAEVFGDAPAREEALAPLVRAVGEEFIKILPIDLPSALAAKDTRGQVDRPRFRASGGQALIAAVLHEVKTGRQGLLDQAELLLHRAGIDPASVDLSAAAAPAPAPTPEETPAAAPSPELGPSEATRVAFEAAIARLARTGADLAAAPEVTPAAIVKRSVQEMQWLSDHLDDVDTPADPALDALRDSATEAADMLQLMQLEKTDSAAMEAVSLMIQLRRRLSQNLHGAALADPASVTLH